MKTWAGGVSAMLTFPGKNCVCAYLAQPLRRKDSASNKTYRTLRFRKFCSFTLRAILFDSFCMNPQEK
jgi:hypothetical protein